MKIAVCVKQAIDESELKSDSSGRPILQGAPTKMSTFDKNAVEEALRVRSSQSGEVVVFSVGSVDAKKTVKEALAMGADRGVLVSDPGSGSDSLRTAEVIAAALAKYGPFDLVFCSEGSSDTYSGLVAPMVAELLGSPYVGYCRKVELSGASLMGERALEDSVESVEATLPSVVSVVSEVNEPRYPTLIQIMQASKKPIDEVSGDALVGPPVRSLVSIVSMNTQTSNRKHLMIEGSPEEAAGKLLDSLEKEGVLRG